MARAELAKLCAKRSVEFQGRYTIRAGASHIYSIHAALALAPQHILIAIGLRFEHALGYPTPQTRDRKCLWLRLWWSRGSLGHDFLFWLGYGNFVVWLDN
jgi:hypothetical protein